MQCGKTWIFPKHFKLGKSFIIINSFFYLSIWCWEKEYSVAASLKTSKHARKENDIDISTRYVMLTSIHVNWHRTCGVDLLLLWIDIEVLLQSKCWLYREKQKRSLDIELYRNTQPKCRCAFRLHTPVQICKRGQFRKKKPPTGSHQGAETLPTTPPNLEKLNNNSINTH